MKKVTFLTGIILLASTLIVSAQKERRSNNSNRSMMNQNCQIPDLTNEQEAKIKELRTTHWKEMKNFRAELDVLRAEMNKLKIADNPDEKAIDAKIDEIGKVRTKMQKTSNHHHLAVRKLLSNEQKVWYDNHNHHGKNNGYKHGSKHGSKHRGHRGKGSGYNNDCRR